MSNYNHPREYQHLLNELFPSKRIAISGRIGAGKTALANLLVKRISEYSDHGQAYGHYGRPITTGKASVNKVSFSDAIRSDLSKYFNIDKKLFTDPATKGQYRWMQLVFGNDLGRRFDENWWVKRFDQEYMSQMQKHHYDWFIVDDVRRLNEFKYLEDNDFTFVRIKCRIGDSLNYLEEFMGIEDPNERIKLIQDPTESELEFLDTGHRDNVININANIGDDEDLFNQLLDVAIQRNAVTA